MRKPTLILEERPEFYTDGLGCSIQKKNAISRTLVLILSVGLSRDTVVVEVRDYSKPCPAVLVPSRTQDDEGSRLCISSQRASVASYSYRCS
jgi:hypothetical protein